MTRLVKVREKGQVTLPLGIRNQLGLQQGDLLEAAVDNGRIVLELAVRKREGPVLLPFHHLGELVGMMKLGGDSVKDTDRYER